jgi:hypothetical protein
MDENLYKLRLLLMEQNQWPLLYYFKFIVPNDKEKVESVKLLFSDPSKVTFNASRDINYISISYKQYMPDADSIIDIYRKAGLIEGLIAL